MSFVRKAKPLYWAVCALWMLSYSACGSSTGGQGGDTQTIDPDVMNSETQTLQDGFVGDRPDIADANDCPYAPFAPPGDPCMVCSCGEDPAGAPECVPVDEGTPCQSEDCCFGPGVCSACDDDTTFCPASGLVCEGIPVVTCDDADPCTSDSPVCEDGQCSCVNEPMDDGAQCVADPNACTEGDTCQAGVCVPGPEVNLESENPCVDLVCVKGEVTEALVSGPCDDGNLCHEPGQCILGQCVVDENVTCPDHPCATTTCEPDQGCINNWFDEGTVCVLSSACVEVATCQPTGSGDVMECVVQQGFDCSDGNPCTEDFCNPEAGDGEQKCTHTYVGDDITCVEDGVTGVCKDGVCDADAPPSEPVISLTPEGASPGAHLFCQVTQASVDPDGDAVEYHFEWHKEGVHVPQYDEILTGALPQATLPFTVTQSCELWSCFVTPVANGLQGPTATASVTTGPDGSVGNGADKVAHNWPPSGGQFPATVGPLQGWGAGEGFAVRIEFDESELPFTIGVIRGVIPNGQAWMAKIWEDQFGQPGFEVASQPGQGTSSTELTDYALSQPYTVASGTSAVWVGFINQNGNGPIPYDEGGATPNSSNPQNYLYGSYIDLLGGGGCPTFFAPCWLPATLHEPNIKNWVVEVGPGTPACP